MVNSSVLIVAHPNSSLVSFGADFVSDMKDALSQLQKAKYSVLCFLVSNISSEELFKLVDLIENKSPALQLIAISNSHSSKNLIEILQKVRLFKILPEYEDPSFEEVT